MGCLSFFPQLREVQLKLWLAGGKANVTVLNLEVIRGILIHNTSHQMKIWVASGVWVTGECREDPKSLIGTPGSPKVI